MTFQQLKEAIIRDETQFIEDLYHDESLSQDEYTERVKELIDEINSCQTPDELMCFYMNEGYSERDAYYNLFNYLIEK